MRTFVFCSCLLVWNSSQEPLVAKPQPKKPKQMWMSRVAAAYNAVQDHPEREEECLDRRRLFNVGDTSPENNFFEGDFAIFFS